MTDFNISHVLGLITTPFLIFLLSTYMGRKVKNTSDFATAGGAMGTVMVAGAFLGTLVGGASTIGTAQMGAEFGMSALWYTLGISTGTLLLGLFFRKVRRIGCTTIEQILEQDYGPRVAVWSAILGVSGQFLNITVQLLSSVALLSTIVKVPSSMLVVISAIIMGSYVMSGGLKSMGAVGVVKIVLIYIIIAIGANVVLDGAGGFDGIRSVLPDTYFNIFSRGVAVDLGSTFSVLLGVMVIQTYIQCILAAKDDATALKGAILAAVLVPPVGFGSMLIGMYMRILYPEMPSAQVFPAFIMTQLPGYLAGVAISILFITVISSGAGLALGISSIITDNIFLKLKPKATDKNKLLSSRISIVLLLVSGMLFSMGDLQGVILKWGFLSMGLRSTVVFLPFVCALFLKNKIHPNAIFVAIFAGPTAMLGSNLFLNIGIEPLFMGMGASFITVAAGYVLKK